MQDTLLKKPHKRNYYRSSSFIMAVTFTVLLGFSAGILVYFVEIASPQNISKIQIFSGIIFLLMLTVITTSFVISIFVVRRINLIAETARDIIQTGDLSRRISIDSHWDDLSNLAQILNRLLDRIEFLMEGVKRVSDNIAHDLRTPLTRLRNELETIRQTTDAATADKLIAEADHLLNTFNALLRIATIETGKYSQTFVDVKLHVILNDVIEFYAPLAEEKNIHLQQSLEEVVIKGDKGMLFQMFANLMDNAIKFTHKDGTVCINLDKDGHIIISDTGIGITQEDMEKVFDRFYRSEASRHTAGNGLGLSLVAAIIELHRWQIRLEDNKPGLKIIISR